MTQDTEKFSVHSKKLYRVILEAIDPSVETEVSFALKLSLRMRTPLPRCKSVVRNMPSTLKIGLTGAQANRFAAILQELGATSRIEAYVVTPDSVERVVPDDEAEVIVEKPTPEDAPDERSPKEPGEKVTCPACGWEEQANATHCSICLRKFRNSDRRPKSLGVKLPHENPLGREFREPDVPAESAQEYDMGDWLFRNGRYFVVGAIILVLFFFLTK